MAAILFMFIATVLFMCIKSWFFRNQLASCLQISHWSYCWNVIVCSNDYAPLTVMPYIVFFFKIKNCLKVDLFISCDDRAGKMLHNICISAMSLRWATRGPWASCFVSCKEYHKSLLPISCQNDDHICKNSLARHFQGVPLPYVEK